MSQKEQPTAAAQWVGEINQHILYLKEGLQRLETSYGEGQASLAETVRRVEGNYSDIQKTMATKEELKELKADLKQLADSISRLDMPNRTEVARELETLEARVLGLETKVDAIKSDVDKGNARSNIVIAIAAAVALLILGGVVNAVVNMVSTKSPPAKASTTKPGKDK